MWGNNPNEEEKKPTKQTNKKMPHRCLVLYDRRHVFVWAWSRGTGRHNGAEGRTPGGSRVWVGGHCQQLLSQPLFAFNFIHDAHYPPPPSPHYSRVRGTSSKIDHIMCITNQSSPLMLLKCISCCAKLWFKKAIFHCTKTEASLNWNTLQSFFFYRSRQNNKDCVLVELNKTSSNSHTRCPSFFSIFFFTEKAFAQTSNGIGSKTTERLFVSHIKNTNKQAKKKESNETRLVTANLCTLTH